MILFLLADNGGVDTTVLKVIGSCHSCVQSFETNSSDVSIANAICSNLYSIVFVCVAGFLIGKTLTLIANGVSGWYKQYIDFKNRKIQEKSKLTDMLLDYLKTRSNIDNSELEKKNVDANKKYINVLFDLIGKYSKNKLNTSSLKSILNLSEPQPHEEKDS